MDEGLSRAVQTIFKRLFDDGLIYRAERIINWCPRCHTALSDIEVEHHEDEGELVELVYGDPEGDDRVVVATTRVETMLGDTAVAVNPEDERYRHLVGREIELPLVGRRIPVVADDHVDPAFGTGAVKVTPAHDPNDFEIGRRHDLPRGERDDARGGRHRHRHAVRRHGPLRGPRRRPRGAARAGPHRCGEAAVPALRRPLLALQDRRRAAAQPPVVRERRPARQGVGRRRPRRAREDPPQGDGAALVRLGRRHARLVHLAAALVGAPDPGLVRAAGRGRVRRPGRRAARRRGLDAGPRRPRHVVLQRPVPVLHAGLAGRHPGPAHVLPEPGARHGLRHPVLLGRADDDVRPLRDGRRPAVRRRRAARHGPRPARQEDVEVVRQRRRPAGVDGPLRVRRAAVHARPGREPRHGRADRRGLGPGQPQLLHEAVERHPVRAAQRRDDGGPAARRPASSRRSTGGCCRGSRR